MTLMPVMKRNMKIPMNWKRKMVGQQRDHTCHPLLGQNLCRGFNTGTKPPKHTIQVRGIILWVQIHGRFPVNSNFQYICIFWHTIILAVVNAWLLCKQDCKAPNIPLSSWSTQLSQRQREGDHLRAMGARLHRRLAPWMPGRDHLQVLGGIQTASQPKGHLYTSQQKYKRTCMDMSQWRQRQDAADAVTKD